MRLKQLSVLRVLAHHCQFKRLQTPLWEVDKFLPFVVLAPAIGFTSEGHVVAGVPVVANSREVGCGWGVGHRPEVEVDRLTRLAIFDAIQRHTTVWSPIVFTVCHK